MSEPGQWFESDPLWFARVRPEFVEVEATRKAIQYGAVAGARTHIVHVTSKAAVSTIATWKSQNGGSPAARPRVHCRRKAPATALTATACAPVRPSLVRACPNMSLRM